eukprot:COSAG02_NODE_1482_length_12387_cov_6.381348_10_plen_176_part_00
MHSVDNLVDGMKHTTEQVMVSKTFEVKGIAALVSLPRLQLGAVLAHELCHAFMHLLRFPRLPPTVEEGLCELWASLWLQAIADGSQQHARSSDESIVRAAEAEARSRLLQMRHNSDPVYGDGLRNAMACYEDFVAKHGDGVSGSLPEFMKFVRQRRTWWKVGRGLSCGIGSVPGI